MYKRNFNNDEISLNRTSGQIFHQIHFVSVESPYIRQIVSLFLLSRTVNSVPPIAPRISDWHSGKRQFLPDCLNTHCSAIRCLVALRLRSPPPPPSARFLSFLRLSLFTTPPTFYFLAAFLFYRFTIFPPPPIFRCVFSFFSRLCVPFTLPSQSATFLLSLSSAMCFFTLSAIPSGRALLLSSLSLLYDN